VRLQSVDQATDRNQLDASGIVALGEPNNPGTPRLHMVDRDGLKVQFV
jgi:hypothetical protein